MVLNVHRNHKAYQGRGERDKGVWRWGEREIIYLSLHCGGRGRLYTYRYTVTTRMTPALRWAVMRAIFNVSVGSDGQSGKTVSTNHNLFEEKGEPKRYRTRSFRSLTPYHWAKPAH